MSEATQEVTKQQAVGQSISFAMVTSRRFKLVKFCPQCKELGKLVMIRQFKNRFFHVDLRICRSCNQPTIVTREPSLIGLGPIRLKIRRKEVNA